jgi:class 3 adenylate cyclase
MKRTELRKQPTRQFYFDLALYSLAGLIVPTVMSTICESNLLINAKLFVGCMIIGYFASVDNSLLRERRMNAESLNVEEDSSLPNKLDLFLLTTVLFAFVATVLAISDTMGWFDIDNNSEIRASGVSYLTDIMFVLATVLVLTFKLIHSYSKNMHHMFRTQLDVLHSVQAGNLAVNLPVYRKDEFGMLAQQINHLIEGMRDRERMRKVLERIVSPNIMEKLLTTDDHVLKSGQEYDVTILFCDLRGFTRLSEDMPAEDVIFFLNSYFSKMTEIVYENHGMINKFMGDAVLAIFGLDNEDRIDNSVHAANQILDYANSIQFPNGVSIEVGVGIHTGKVIAGTIGSEERYEYTFIGDAVNTASRLDGLTKRLGYSIIVSNEAYKELPGDMKANFVDLGKHMLRGKREPVHVHGSGGKQAWGEQDERKTQRL